MSIVDILQNRRETHFSVAYGVRKIRFSPYLSDILFTYGIVIRKSLVWSNLVLLPYDPSGLLQILFLENMYNQNASV